MTLSTVELTGATITLSGAATSVGKVGDFQWRREEYVEEGGRYRRNHSRDRGLAVPQIIQI